MKIPAITGKAKKLWEAIIPQLEAAAKIEEQHYIMLEQGFLLLEEVYQIQKELNDTRKGKDADRNKRIDSLNGQLVRTARACATIFEKLGFCPSDNNQVEEMKEENLLESIIDDRDRDAT